MARWLYNLGTWSARRAWVVVLVWTVLLGGLGTAAMTLSNPFTSEIKVPGTEFQAVIDDLQLALPAAAGGSGTVVFSTIGGEPFTQPQTQAIGVVVSQWEATDGVESATDPFTTQEKLDDAKTDIADGQKDLADGWVKIRENTKKLADAKDNIADGRATIAENEAKLADGEAKLDAAQRKLNAGRTKLNAGTATITKNEKKLTSAQAALTKNRASLDAALAAQGMTEQSVPAALSQLEAAMAGMQEQLQTLIDQVGKDDPQAVALQQQIAGYQAQADQLRSIEFNIAQIEAGQKKLDAGFDALNKGKVKLASSRKQLAASQATIDANRAKIANGKRQLAHARTTLNDAAVKVSDGEQELAEGKQELLDGEANLARGARQLALTDGLRLVSQDGTVAVSRMTFTTPSDEVSKSTRAAIPAAAARLAQQSVQVDYSKEVQGTPPTAFGKEGSGLVIAALVLLVMLGSLLAAGLPLLTALVGVGVGLLGVVATTHWVPMTEFTPTLALMLGLAVGIDYALFLVNRHRHQLAGGAQMIDSIGRATGTAGNAVVVAGVTVITALSALTLTGIPFLGLMGLAAAATVAISVLVSITLTPALLRLIGARILSRRGREKLAARKVALTTDSTTAKTAARAEAAAERGKGWGGLVTRHPLLALGASVLVLGVLAVPATSLKTGLPDGSFEPQKSTAYRADALTSDNFGAGENATMIAVAKLPAATAATLTEDGFTDLQLDIAERLNKAPGIAYVVPATVSKDHQTLVFQIVPTTGSSDDATAALVNTLRANRNPIVAVTGITSLGFAGQTVADIDISALLAVALPGYLIVVVGISLILLLMVFRSLVVPLLATGGFLLSIAAAFGGVVAVYQWGWLGPVFGVEHAGVILSFLPTLTIGILFGLAMDYQMFLVSGVRESWAHGQEARTAVRTGFTHGAKVITAAALIMTAVFAGFMQSDITMARPIGFVLAFGVLIDAFIVRMTIMPALMHLFGATAWYLPKWLDHLLPNLDVEGTRLSEYLKHTHPQTDKNVPRQAPGQVVPDPA